jgi:uncharacterized protein with ATP-grasp and redox domains
MKLQEKCIPCIVSQSIKVADMVGIDDKNDLLKEMFRYLSDVDFSNISSPELIGENFNVLKRITGNGDPYKETREKYNKMFLDRIDLFEEEIAKSEDDFMEAVKYAIIGNVIDFNPIHELTVSDVNEKFETLKTESLEIDDTRELQKDIDQAKSILYLGDNCGEICLDKILIKKIKERNPACQIYFATRGSAVVNDSVEDDAYLVGMDEYASIISNGDCSLGTVLTRTSKEFNNIYYNADIIIAKGQANYECLSNEDENIYFLLMTKCDVIAKSIGVPEMKMICMKSTFK